MTGPKVHPLLKAEILRAIHVPLACFSVYLSRMVFFLVVERFNLLTDTAEVVSL